LQSYDLCAAETWLASRQGAVVSAVRRGAFEAAWAISDAVLQARASVPCWHLPRHLQYIWDGTPLAGKRVLVRCYHGLGDTIQFIRYAPLIKTIAREVIVWAQPALLPLLRTYAPCAALIDSCHCMTGLLTWSTMSMWKAWNCRTSSVRR